MIFVDTGAWFALSVETDRDYLAATRFIDRNSEPLVTTDYVVDELLKASNKMSFRGSNCKRRCSRE